MVKKYYDIYELMIIKGENYHVGQENKHKK